MKAFISICMLTTALMSSTVFALDKNADVLEATKVSTKANNVALSNALKEDINNSVNLSIHQSINKIRFESGLYQGAVNTEIAGKKMLSKRQRNSSDEE